MVVGGILLTLAIPNFRNFAADNALIASSNELVTHINLTRAQAINRNVPVSICASGDASTCSNSTRWDTGWIVFTDNTGAKGEIDGSDEILRIHSDPNGHVNILGGGTYIRYGPTGIRLD